MKKGTWMFVWIAIIAVSASLAVYGSMEAQSNGIQFSPVQKSLGIFDGPCRDPTGYSNCEAGCYNQRAADFNACQTNKDADSQKCTQNYNEARAMADTVYTHTHGSCCVNSGGSWDGYWCSVEGMIEEQKKEYHTCWKDALETRSKELSRLNEERQKCEDAASTALSNCMHDAQVAFGRCQDGCKQRYCATASQ